MPRTKISKNSKRNRQTTRSDELSEKLKEIELNAEQTLTEIDAKFRNLLRSHESNIQLLRNRFPKSLLLMKLGDLMDLDINTLDEYKQINATNSVMNTKFGSSNSMASVTSNEKCTRQKSKEDEGYITEDGVKSTKTSHKNMNGLNGGQFPPTPAIRTKKLSSILASASAIHTESGQTARPLGPFGSAVARSRLRRSRSALAFVSDNKNKINQQDQMQQHQEENHQKPLRTMSADRSANFIMPKIKPNAPISLFRYPKMGETVVSLSGSPIVAQGLADPYGPNVNIPVKNGILSLRPTKLDCTDRDIITQQLDNKTLQQIKQLKSNLSLIMSHAIEDN